MITDRTRLPRCISSTRSDAKAPSRAACAAIVHKASTASRNAVVGSPCDSLERSSAASAASNETGGINRVVVTSSFHCARAAAPLAPNTLNGALSTRPKPGVDATSE